MHILHILNDIYISKIQSHYLFIICHSDEFNAIHLKLQSIVFILLFIHVLFYLLVNALDNIIPLFLFVLRPTPEQYCISEAVVQRIKCKHQPAITSFRNELLQTTTKMPVKVSPQEHQNSHSKKNSTKILFHIQVIWVRIFVKSINLGWSKIVLSRMGLSLMVSRQARSEISGVFLFIRQRI